MISLLGSTGSIGRQTVEVLEHLSLRPAALSANRNIKLLEEQARRLRPALAAVYDEKAAKDLKISLSDTAVRVVSGMDGLIEAAVMPQAHTVVSAVMGMIGLRPTLAAISEKKRIALANKETLVCAGQLVMDSAARHNAEIIPVDSEHSAIFQCLRGADGNPVRRVVLTASGGPFFGWKQSAMRSITPDMALAHPTWRMGAKITVDSATLMNKGLEFIEAMWLYGLTPEQIEVVIHRESVIHSAVEFQDGSMLAQMGLPDMRMPIQYALTYPSRSPGLCRPLDLTELGSMSFSRPDYNAFPCLKLAVNAASQKGSAGAVLSGANEAAVALFLEEELGFTQISESVEHALCHVRHTENPSLEELLEADRAARQAVIDFKGGTLCRL